jgi:hypothetical protein
MEQRCHHYCHCTGQSFTFDEWSEYIRQHDTPREVVYRHNGFEYNIHDACLNKELVFSMIYPTAKLELFVDNPKQGLWVSTMDFHTSNMASLGGRDVSGRTKEELLRLTADWVIHHFLSSPRIQSHRFYDGEGERALRKEERFRKDIDRLCADLKAWAKPKAVQLSLFDDL